MIVTTQVTTQVGDMTVAISRPKKNDAYPLRRHRNGQWFKSVWNPRTKRSEQFYFGTWADDLEGERALLDPITGWLARRKAIVAGVDNSKVELGDDTHSPGELMARFLTFKRNKVQAGELSLTTLGDYLREIEQFVSFCKPSTPAGGLRPEHFTAYMNHLTNGRKLGRMARKRVRAYVTAFLRHGAKNGWYTMPNTGSDWVAPATDPAAMRQARARAGLKDNSQRIISGEEIDRLLQRASPTFKALILLAANTGLGPGDLGRMTWDKINMKKRTLVYPRSKSGQLRVGFLWKKTRRALLYVRRLKHNRLAIENNGDAALVFITRRGRAYYSEREIQKAIDVGGKSLRKLTGVAISNAICVTFGRIAKDVGLKGIGIYRLRHSFLTHGKKARDPDALSLMMGHTGGSRGVAHTSYDHEEISWRRIRHVARIVYSQLWPKRGLIPLPFFKCAPARGVLFCGMITGNSGKEADSCMLSNITPSM
ncbi:MAG: tyrosine-type recombinase/integrase, partial [Tepidisphaeraceae bacterium]